jgi:hypothetical protein
MKKAGDFYTKHIIPENPGGKLQITPGVNLQFPIEEKYAITLVAELNAVIDKAYKRGLNDGAEPSCKHPKTSCDDKRIQHVYAQAGALVVASVHSHSYDPQFIKNLIAIDLLVEQINGMIDRAEERGCVKGYRACLNDQFYSKE